MGGDADKAAGRIKEAAGGVTNDKDLESEGKAQQAAGNVKKVGEKLMDKADDLGETIKK